jgi:putative endonuclease
VRRHQRTTVLEILAQSEYVRIERNYYVYILFGKTGVLYIGMTNDLYRRVFEHKTKFRPGFTQKYNVTKLAYFEETNDVTIAIAREKELKGWRRSKKIALIETQNPNWTDLSKDWY